MTSFRGHRGLVLITVLIVTAVGLLFGAGALLLFRYQCQQRIDRQHEVEKLYAVRSALNYIRTAKSDISEFGKSFRYVTASTRDLGVIVKPVAPIFPLGERHFCMERGDFCDFLNWADQYDAYHDCEFGAIGVTNFVMSYVYKTERGLAFTDLTATNGVKWWVNIGMRGTGGWLQEDYGRRYYFNLMQCLGDEVGTAATRDLIRLCVIRSVTNKLHGAGSRYGWPLSEAGGRRERALVFESSLVSGTQAKMSIWEYVYGVQPKLLVEADSPEQTLNYIGIQIADDKVSIFYIDSGTGDNDGPPRCVFLDPVGCMSAETKEYFAEGAYRDDEGKIVKAPELRAVLEVEACSNKRQSPPISELEIDVLTNLRVTPAYQYDVLLEHPDSVTNRATVAQRCGKYNTSKIGYTVLTYDTHGTENKGFRKDEREAERKRNGR